MVTQTGWKGGLLIGHKQMAMVSRVQKHLNYHESVNDIMPFIDGIGRELNLTLSGLNIHVTRWLSTTST
jgi:hypothetical protein